MHHACAAVTPPLVRCLRSPRATVASVEIDAPGVGANAIAPRCPHHQIAVAVAVHIPHATQGNAKEIVLGLAGPRTRGVVDSPLAPPLNR